MEIMSTTNQPLVSVIVITYNSSKFVVETLESARAQTYQNIELIISDDCSTDNTVEICQEWISKNRLRFVRVELISVIKNTGIPANCNRGAKMARGTWLKFIAGDDVLCSNCIKDNIEFVKSNSLVRFVSSRFIYIDQDSRIIENVYDEHINLRKHYFALDQKEQLRFYVRIPLFLNSPTFFINRDALIQLNYFDEDLRVYEDISLVYRCNTSGNKFYFMDQTTFKYRMITHSISRIKDEVVSKIKISDQKLIFKKYRAPKLSFFNILDISVYYDYWLNYHYQGIGSVKGRRLLKMISPLYWYFLIIKLKCYI